MKVINSVFRFITTDHKGKDSAGSCAPEKRLPVRQQNTRDGCGRWQASVPLRFFELVDQVQEALYEDSGASDEQ